MQACFSVDLEYVFCVLCFNFARRTMLIKLTVRLNKEGGGGGSM